MKYVIYVEEAEEAHDEFVRNPRNQYEGEVHAYVQKATVYTIQTNKKDQIKFVLEALALKHPGRQVTCAKVENTAQCPYFAGDIAFTSLSEKGLLPE